MNLITKYNEYIKEGFFPQSSLSDMFQMELSDELMKLKGHYWVKGRDLYKGDDKLFTIDNDDSVNRVIKKLKDLLSNPNTDEVTSESLGYEETGFLDDIDGENLYISFNKYNDTFSIENDVRVIKKDLSFDDIKALMKNKETTNYDEINYLNNISEFKEFQRLLESPFMIENINDEAKRQKYIKDNHPHLLNAYLN